MGQKWGGAGTREDHPWMGQGYGQKRHSQDHHERTATEEAEERETLLASVEAVILDEHEWVRLEKQVDDTVHERHVQRDREEHRLER